MAVTLAEKFLPYVDEQFKAESKKSLLTNQDFNWTGAHTVKIYKISTAAMTDYGRTGPTGTNWSRYGAVAGLDAAIGDFVYEFDTLQTPYAPEMIWQAYEKALEGNDIVTVGPEKTRACSRLFYSVFNRFSRSAYPVGTDAFRLVSRRAINRVHAVSEHLPYRKAAYAASGLRVAALTFSGRLAAEDGERLDLAADSLALYTAAGYRLSLTVTVGMLLLTLAELVYTLAVALTGRPIEGWTTTMFVLTVGFFGVFLVLTLVIKYLSLLVDLVFRRQKYLVESIEKLQK